MALLSFDRLGWMFCQISQSLKLSSDTFTIYHMGTIKADHFCSSSPVLLFAHLSSKN